MKIENAILLHNLVRWVFIILLIPLYILKRIVDWLYGTLIAIPTRLGAYLISKVERMEHEDNAEQQQ